jgi:hypothetical protein
VLAEGNVHVVTSKGSELRGPRAEYFRAAPPIRSTQRLVAPDKPVFDLMQKDSAGGPPKRTNLVADHVVSEADSLFYAGGGVVITREDVIAKGDSAYVDQGTEFARLMRQPVIEGKGDRAFTLKGSLIEMFSKNRELQRVIAKDSANVVSKDIDLVADTIDLRTDKQKLNRAFAWGKGRARARSPGRDIFADSIDVQMPNQQIREVHALRNAYAESDPDSTKLKSKERDWVKGDTLLAQFDSVARNPKDTSTNARLRQMIANGNASSFYQVPSGKSPTDRPALNYVRGRIITVALDSGQVQRVTVVDKATGVYLEPSADTTAAKPNPRRNTRQQPQRPTPTTRRPPNPGVRRP